MVLAFIFLWKLIRWICRRMKVCCPRLHFYGAVGVAIFASVMVFPPLLSPLHYCYFYVTSQFAFFINDLLPFIQSVVNTLARFFFWSAAAYMVALAVALAVVLVWACISWVWNFVKGLFQRCCGSRQAQAQAQGQGQDQRGRIAAAHAPAAAHRPVAAPAAAPAPAPAAPSCSICLDSLPDVLFRPCKHVTCCETCVEQLMAEVLRADEDEGSIRCPKCRRRVVMTEKLFIG